MSNDNMSGTTSFTGTAEIAAGTVQIGGAPAERKLIFPRTLNIGGEVRIDGETFIGFGNIDTSPYGGGAWIRTYDESGNPLSEERLTAKYGAEKAQRILRETHSAVEKAANDYYELWRAYRSIAAARGMR
jgi:hypothetical protein